MVAMAALLLLAILPQAHARWGTDAHGVLEFNGVRQLKLVEKAVVGEKLHSAQNATQSKSKIKEPQLHTSKSEKAWVTYMWEFLNSRALLSIVPVITVQVVFLAPSYTLFNAAVDKRVGELSLSPYTLMICNSLAWATYGAVLHDAVIAIGHAFGVVFGLVYFVSVCLAAPKAAEIFHHVVVIALTVTLGIVATLFTGDQAADIMGYTALFLSVSSLTGPFSSSPKKTGHAASRGTLAFFKVAAVLNCLAWAGYGYSVAENLTVYLPNVVGCFILLLELLAFLCTSHGPSKTKAKKVFDEAPFYKQPSVEENDVAVVKKKKHKKSVSFKFEEGQRQWGEPYYLR